jgi:hypothetical protein
MLVKHRIGNEIIYCLILIIYVMKNAKLARLTKSIEKKGLGNPGSELELISAEMTEKIFGGGSNHTCTCSNSGCSC